MFKTEANTRAGKGKRNEDYFSQKEFDNGDILVALADGMGDTDCAEDSAILAVETICSCFEKDGSIKDSLERAVMLANDRIADVCLARRCKMGCAIAVAYLSGDKMWFVSLGNVRIHQKLADGSVNCITNDDVYVASNDNVFLTRSLSGKDMEGKVMVCDCCLTGVNQITLSTDGEYNQDENDDATIIEIKILKMKLD